MPTKFVINRFEPRMVADGSNILHLGKKNTGKTTGMFDILYEKRHTPDGEVYCGTAGANNKFELIVPGLYIHSGFQEDKIMRSIERNKTINKRRNDQGLPKKYTFMVWDDCGWDEKFCNNRCVREILMNGRHYGFTTFISLQYPLGFKPAMRNNFDWIILHREVLPNNRKRLYEHYASGFFPSYDAFCEVLDRVTENYGALVIRNTGTTTRLEDNVFFWQPKVRDYRENKRQKRWHMGSKAYWEFHFKHYDKRWDERSSEDDQHVARKTTRRRPAAKIVLRKKK